MNKIVAVTGEIRQAQEEHSALLQYTDPNQWLSINFPETYQALAKHLTLTGEERTLIPSVLIAEHGDRESLELAVHSFGRNASDFIFHVRDSKDVSDLYFLNRRTGGNASGLLFAFGVGAVEEFNKHFPFYDGIAQRLRELGAENLIEEAYSFCRSHVTEHPNLTPNILNWIQQLNEPKRILDLLYYFSSSENVKKFETAPTLIDCMVLYEYKNATIQKLDRAIPWDLAEKNERFMVEYFYFAQGFVLYALNYLTQLRTQFEKEIIDKFLSTPEDKKFIFWSLLGAYLKTKSYDGPVDFIERTASEVSNIEKHCKSTTHIVLDAIHPKHWSESNFLQILRVYGTSYAGILEWKRISKGSLLSNSDAQEVLQQSKNKLRINHFYRYIPAYIRQVDAQLQLLKDNLDSLNPNYQKDSRLAIIVLADYDHNLMAFQRVIQEIQDLKHNGYKVIFFEAETHRQSFDSIYKWATLHKNQQGETSRGIHYLRFITHAEAQRVIFGDPQYDLGRDVILDIDSKAIRSLSKILHPDKPVINFGGCLLGHGRNPFGRAFKSHVPNAKVIVSKGCFDTGNLVFDSTGMVIDTEGKDRVVF